MLLRVLAKNWWMVLLRGVAAIVFGLLVVIFTDVAVGVFVAFFGAYALVDGIFTIVAAFQGEDRDRLWHIARGALGIIVGIIAWVDPDLTEWSLILFIGVWAIVTGVMEIVVAWRLRQQITNEFWLILGGALSILFGLFCLFAPAASALTLATVIGIYAIIFGAILVAFSLRLRSLKDRQGPLGRGQAPASA